MASRYEISAVFRMIDNFTSPMARVSANSSAFTKKVNADMKKMEMQIKAAGQTLKTMSGIAAGAVVALAGATVVDSIKTYVAFEDAVTKAGSKFKDLDVTSADYQKTLEELQLSAREVGAKTKFSATDAAGALDKMAMAGLTSKQSMAMLFGTTNLAAAAGIDLTSAVDMATDALGAFNLNSEDSEQITKNMNRIADVVAKTTNMANLDMSMWFESVKMGASTFTSLGGTIEEFSALAGTLANSGIKGSQAGNELKNMMLNLSAPAKSGAEALGTLGISVFDSQGKMLPFLDIMAQFEKKLAGMADEKKEDLLKDIFGKDQIGAFNILLSAGTRNLRDFTTTLENSGGTAQKIAEAQSNSFAGLIEQLKSAFQDKQLSIGKAFEIGGAREALKGLIDYISTMDITPIVTILTTAMQNLPGIVQNISSVISFLWQVKDAIGAVMIGIAAYKATILALTVVQGIRNGLTALGIGQIAAETVATTAQTAATTEATVAQTGLNAAIMANPIGLIITGIIALGFAIYEIVKHWDTVKAALLSACETFKNFMSGIWTGLKKLGGSIISFLLTPLIKALDLLSNIPLIGDKIKVGADKLRDFQNYASSGFGSVETPVTLANSSVPTSVQEKMNQPVANPVTQAQQTSYSLQENNTTTKATLEVYMGKGLNGKLLNSSPMIDINTLKSGAW